MNDLNRSIKIFIDGTEASAGVKKIEDAITQLENKISSLDKSESGYSKKSKTLQKELENGAHILYEGTELMGGPFTMISGVAMERFYKDYPALYEAFLSALQESVDYINDHIDEAAAQLAPVYGITEQELKVLKKRN